VSSSVVSPSIAVLGNLKASSLDRLQLWKQWNVVRLDLLDEHVLLGGGKTVSCMKVDSRCTSRACSLPDFACPHWREQQSSEGLEGKIELQDYRLINEEDFRSTALARNIKGK